MTARLANSYLGGEFGRDGIAGFFAAADPDDQPVGRRIPARLRANREESAGSVVVFTFHADGPVSLEMPDGAIRQEPARTYRPPRPRWLRISRDEDAPDLWYISVTRPRLHHLRRPREIRLPPGPRMGRVGFFTDEGVPFWDTGWKVFFSVADRIDIVDKGIPRMARQGGGDA